MLRPNWRKMKRIWVPVEQWEEIAHNMWGEVADRKRWLHRAVTFTGNHRLYGHYMMRVTQEWPHSCSNALTDQSLNRRAWIGHAACALAFRCPEDITRQAWGLLSHEQRVLANSQADRAIQSWEMRHQQSARLPQDMEAALLSRRHPRRSTKQGGSFRQGSILAGSSHGIA